MKKLADIYVQHKQGLFSLALSILRSSAEAEDAVHDAFVKLTKKDISDKSEPVAYVYATVRNTALDRLRRKKKIVDLPEFVFEDKKSKEAIPGKSLQERERNFIVRKEIENLDEPQREVVMMKLYGGLTFEQISEALSEPLSTVSSRYARTLKSMKSKMEALV
ncbi:MAG: sigma-70 family RNA polymerase sigma factor [Lentisphaeraceae bacterium]|nr:sigma-70 family RNA polymerase sigma factor [Lentisphaeraceae bacterium]